jgi:AAHS family benzoate transporter-like MFS transporter
VRATGIGWAHAAGRVGSIAGPVIGGMVQTWNVGFSIFFVVFSIPAFVCAVLVLFYRIDARAQSLEGVGEALKGKGA